jgi:hypothetical protein
MGTLTKLALGMMGQLRPKPAKGEAPPKITLPSPRKDGGMPLQPQSIGDRLAIDPRTDNGGEPIAGREQIQVLRDRTGRDRCVALALANWDQFHAAVVRDKHQVQGSLVNKVLVARHAPKITSGYKLQRVCGGVIEVRARGKRNVNVDLLSVQSGRRGPPPIRSVYAISCP